MSSERDAGVQFAAVLGLTAADILAVKGGADDLLLCSEMRVGILDVVVN